MTLPKPTVVIFDMDGTTVRHLNPRILEVMEKLDDFSYKAFKALGKIFGFIKLSKRQKQARKRRKLSPKRLVHRTIHKLRRKPVEMIVEPCPNVQDILDFFKGLDIPLGLVSNGLGRGYGHDILSKFDFEHYYGGTLFAEDINKSKPDPEPIINILKSIKSETTEDDVIWYIGDRHKDINAALNAREHVKGTVFPIAYGYFGSACLAVLESNLGTDHIIGSYLELLTEIEKIYDIEIDLEAIATGTNEDLPTNTP